MPKSLLLAALLAASVPLVSGCIIAVHDSGDDDSGSHSEAERERLNRRVISELTPGTSIDSVRAELGEPDFSETLSTDGKLVRLYRYRSHHMHSDGETTLDETTVLVFVDGLLQGTGDTAVQMLMAQ